MKHVLSFKMFRRGKKKFVNNNVTDFGFVANHNISPSLGQTVGWEGPGASESENKYKHVSEPKIFR